MQTMTHAQPWIPPQPPPAVMAEATTTIRHRKNNGLKKEQQLIDGQFLARPAEQLGELSFTYFIFNTRLMKEYNEFLLILKSHTCKRLIHVLFAQHGTTKGFTRLQGVVCSPSKRILVS